MSNVPEGAQLSDDGQWWWDGNDWQPVQGSADSSSSTAPASEAGIETWPENPDEWTNEQKEMFFTVTDQTTDPESLDADLGDPAEISEGTELA